MLPAKGKLGVPDSGGVPPGKPCGWARGREVGKEILEVAIFRRSYPATKNGRVPAAPSPETPGGWSIIAFLPSW
jgi:hypothetical protein